MMAAYWRAYMPSLLCNALSHSGMLNIARINHVVIKEGMHMTEQHPSPEEKADAAAGRQQRKNSCIYPSDCRSLSCGIITVYVCRS